MSYCRWSNDFGQCDVYVYEDVNGGWTTHVAGRRLKHLPPQELMDMPVTNGDEFVALYKAEQAWRDTLPRDEDGWILDSEYVEVPVPYAGQGYNHDTPGECADNLEELKAAGLLVPQYAIDALREEEAES